MLGPWVLSAIINTKVKYLPYTISFRKGHSIHTLFTFSPPKVLLYQIIEFISNFIYTIFIYSSQWPTGGNCDFNIYSRSVPSVWLCFQWDGSCSDHVLSTFIGGNYKQELLVEGLVQQLENPPALTVVRQVSTEPQPCIRLARVRVFLLQEEKLSYSGAINNTVTYEFYLCTMNTLWLILLKNNGFPNKGHWPCFAPLQKCDGQHGWLGMQSTGFMSSLMPCFTQSITNPYVVA